MNIVTGRIGATMTNTSVTHDGHCLVLCEDRVLRME